MKHIKKFQNFVNELHSSTYLSASDKMKNYSAIRSAEFKEMADKRREEEEIENKARIHEE